MSPLPFGPGIEMAGIAAAGRGVARCRIGDCIAAPVDRGGFADYVAIDDAHASTAPDSVAPDRLGRPLPRDRLRGRAHPAIPLNLPPVKGAAIVGMFCGELFRRAPALHAETMAELFDGHAEGELRPVTGARFPLSRGGEAIRRMIRRPAGFARSA